jgi:glutamate N-acetyltransferase/amino-acid N-acetyltransferase
MENGQPLPFDRSAASAYLKQKTASNTLQPDTELVSIDQSNDLLVVKDGETSAFERSALRGHFQNDTVLISVSLGNGHGFGKAWGCDLSYDYVKINAEYTT